MNKTLFIPTSWISEIVGCSPRSHRNLKPGTRNFLYGLRAKWLSAIYPMVIFAAMSFSPILGGKIVVKMQAQTNLL